MVECLRGNSFLQLAESLEDSNLRDDHESETQPQWECNWIIGSKMSETSKIFHIQL